MAHGRCWLRLVSLAVLAILLGLGGLSLLFSDRTNYCEMTYMFEYPKFVHIQVPGNEFYPQYSLYSYSEGRLTEKARKMRFDGIPVLYLPGNSGSRSQARSFASVAMRMAFSDERDFHFDYFTVSFNEELSGLYGGVLEKQTKFTSLVLRKIIGLYKPNRHSLGIPKSVIIIGHSMGGVIAQRLLLYEDSANLTSVAVTLAAPLAAPTICLDSEMDRYYTAMYGEWSDDGARDGKVLLSFGGGARDLLVPLSLIVSEYSDFSSSTTAIPGVWTSTDHLSIVWCRQFMIKFNRFLFSIVDRGALRVSGDKELILRKARQYFQANRSMTLSPDVPRAVSVTHQDAFWYEDNRRIYQISRPSINRMTYLMIRLTGIHLDRFLAIETIDHSDKEWLFACTAAYTHGNHRICTNATSLSELTRWTGSAVRSRRRWLATVHLHDLMMRHPEWTHVIVKISPTRKPFALNMDINDFASRNVTVDLPSAFPFGKTAIKEETEKSAIYYQLVLPGMTQLDHTYLLYVEPTASCRAMEYHVSAEMHVPWAKNMEYFHYFTQLQKKPMKLRLFKSIPNIINETEVEAHVKVTLLLDPQCNFSISIELSRYHSLGQLLRQHVPVLFPYMAAILLLAVRSVLISLEKSGACESVHNALAGETMRPYYTVVFGRLGTMALMTIPVLSYSLETSGVKNTEVLNLTHSLLTVPVYMAALGAVNVLAAAALTAIVFCSQLAHRLMLRIIWRGGGGSIAEHVASVLQRAPALVSAALVCSVPMSCGAAALAAGGAFYFFMLSKMYEDYLQDYAYKLLAKVGAKMRRYFKSRKNKVPSETSKSSALFPNTVSTQQDQTVKDVEIKSIEHNPLMQKNQTIKERNIKVVENNSLLQQNQTAIKKDIIVIENNPSMQQNLTVKEKENKAIEKNPLKIILNNPDMQLRIANKITNSDDKSDKFLDKTTKQEYIESKSSDSVDRNVNITLAINSKNKKSENSKDIGSDVKEKGIEADEGLSGLNFHFIMFLLWIIVAGVNIPALLTWARNFKYSIVLRPDTSFVPGMLMSLCAGALWQISSPRRNLKYHDIVSQLIFTMAIIIIVMGPLAAYYINYLVTTAFVLITLQQLFDSEICLQTDEYQPQDADNNSNPEPGVTEENLHTDNTESKIYETMKNMRDKMEFNDTDIK